ncbi:predicted protein [Sclerotinia sclerotiorum 1980 UF-70]|uniref:Reverse transcriptase zinc-binding domain-containing protein n=1 Tax=Sclerotinia sclerotiorum (strain ATCC 18683 / 1980 / Ss-1) TaxID=665079 RepID=A7EW18_SCLS1|nr:predicted protein [Sclerotinia sclerotiorum 1980 UF-70]EDN93660.1 predicted protein [Sclerotinia sclerotiorum 1980 UF-70]
MNTWATTTSMLPGSQYYELDAVVRNLFSSNCSPPDPLPSWLLYHWIDRVMIIQSLLHIAYILATGQLWTFNSSQIFGISSHSAAPASKSVSLSTTENFGFGLSNWDKDCNWTAILNTNNIHQPSSTHSRNYPWKISSKIGIPGNTKRSIISALFQLKIGHGYFKSYLKRFGISTNDNCRCGEWESPDHLLLNCSIYNTARRLLKKDNPNPQLTMKHLLHTKTGITKTLEFIEATRIATRSWHLNRIEEEIGEQDERERVT